MDKDQENIREIGQLAKNINKEVKDVKIVHKSSSRHSTIIKFVLVSKHT
jgi:fructose-1,6-bisphosphatase/sedoheptulose 1,7-bisphosphatase-like protein